MVRGKDPGQPDRLLFLRETSQDRLFLLEREGVRLAVLDAGQLTPDVRREGVHEVDVVGVELQGQLERVDLGAPGADPVAFPG